jgi:hypothetical protein
MKEIRNSLASTLYLLNDFLFINCVVCGYLFLFSTKASS